MTDNKSQDHYDWTQFKFQDKQRLFVMEFLVDKCMKSAAIRAGYSEKSAEKIGPATYHLEHVKHAIDWHLAQQMKRIEVTADRVTQELAAVAFLDPRKFFTADGQLKAVAELEEFDARALASLDLTIFTNDDGEVETTKKIRFQDKLKALELLGKTFKMFTDKVEIAERPKVVVHRYTGRNKKKES